jgi:hypothetical protein
MSFSNFSITHSDNIAVNLYSNWHKDTELQIQAHGYAIPGAETNMGLSLVTQNDLNIQSNRFIINSRNYSATEYLSSSGLSVVLLNSIYDKINSKVSPDLFFYLLRLINLSITFICIYYLFAALSKKLNFYPLNGSLILFLLTPWIFLDSTSLFWSLPARFAPIFYISYLVSKNDNLIILKFWKTLLLTLSLVVSTFCGFEYSFLVFMSATLLFLKLFPKSEHKSRLNLLVAIIFSAVLSILSWLLMLRIYLHNWSDSMNVLKYTFFKHMASNSSIPPFGGLASGDSAVGILQSLIRVTIQTSLILPYDLIQLISNNTSKTNFLTKFTIGATSFGVILVIIFFYKKPKKIFVSYILVYLIWILTIKSYVYHHVHIIGTALILYLMVYLLLKNDGVDDVNRYY